jgi:hypothetical protein
MGHCKISCGQARRFEDNHDSWGWPHRHRPGKIARLPGAADSNFSDKGIDVSALGLAVCGPIRYIFPQFWALNPFLPSISQNSCTAGLRVRLFWHPGLQGAQVSSRPTFSFGPLVCHANKIEATYAGHFMSTCVKSIFGVSIDLADVIHSCVSFTADFFSCGTCFLAEPKGIASSS